MTAWLDLSQISEIFAEQIAAAGGEVTSIFEDRGRLFARSVLPPCLEVAGGDKVQGGVALRATEADIFVHPYVFRQVCTNGAIMAQATQTRHISRQNWFVDPQCEGDLEPTIRVAIDGCCVPEAFVVAADQMRAARHSQIDMALMMSGYMTALRGPMMKKIMGDILRQYDREANRSAFGFMNAITAVARDTRDPETKWRLEELGGSIPAKLRGRKPAPSRGAKREFVSVD